MRLLSILFFLTGFFISQAQDTIKINIDLGGNNSSLPWNNISNSSNGIIQNLSDQFGNATDISFQVYDAFNGTNETGTTTPDPNLNIVTTASSDSFFGNNTEFAGGTEITGGVRFSGLDVTKKYSLEIFASRLANDNRQTQYNITSSSTDTLYLDVADNMDKIVTLASLTPQNDGTIDIECTTGPDNTNSFGFFYLGMMRLTYEDEIMVQEPELILTHPNGGEYWQPGKSPEIRWQSKNVQTVLLEYSINGGNNWESITSTNGLTQAYSWTIPNLPTEECMVRISADTLNDQSNEVFTIPSEDSLNCHIVVLGSSTAAGTGPTSLDSAWVWMFRDTLFQRDTRFEISNLARGGFTTYNILPTGAVIPTGINQSIDESRNITQALSLDPDAIIINLPSNDAANSYSVENQLANYDQILEEVIELELPHWICTPQPRNGFSSNQVSIQEEMRDSTYARFDAFAVDFWSTLEIFGGFIDFTYDSGDGVHLNNAGHKILLERILEKEINFYLLDEKNPTSSIQSLPAFPSLRIYPNPTEGTINIPLEPPFDIAIFNIAGKRLSSSIAHKNQKIELHSKGLNYILISKDDERYGSWLFAR